jgi:ABC-type polysaccharide/polyol phosphate transport system ATPase subunit
VTRVTFDRVWKKFRIGERHDSLRDLIPAAVGRLFRPRPAGPLAAHEFWAIRDVSFEVGPGDVVGIIGPNGAGKSTALKLLSRILRPTSGRAEVRGRVGALIEVAAGFHPDLTGRENVFLQGAILGMTRADTAARFDEIVAFAELERFIDTPVKHYSSGMNARLGFSVVAHLEPEVLLVDEVLAVGDTRFQQKCYVRMRRFKDEGVTMVFVSHNLTAIAQLCNTTVLLDAGRAVAVGRTAEVIARYCSGTSNATGREASVQATLRTACADAGNENVQHVAPGSRLALDVTIDFHRSVERADVGVVIWAVHSETYVSGVSSDAMGVPLVTAVAGERRSFTFEFTAHLARGLYAIEVNVVDVDRHTFLAQARGIRHFDIVESVTFDGVGYLYFTGTETTAPMETCESGAQSLA